MSLAGLKKKKARVGHVPNRYHLKKGDTVMVISGKDKGQTGVVKKVFTSQGKALVEGLNMVKKSVKPNPQIGQQGGIVEMEAPLYVSKLMVYDLKSQKPTRVGKATIEGSDGKPKRVRVSKKSGEHLD